MTKIGKVLSTFSHHSTNNLSSTSIPIPAGRLVCVPLYIPIETLSLTLLCGGNTSLALLTCYQIKMTYILNVTKKIANIDILDNLREQLEIDSLITKDM